MTTTKKNTDQITWNPSSEDEAAFDAYTEDDLDRDILAAAETLNGKYMVIENKTFKYRFPTGVIVAVPINISLDDLEKVTENNDSQIDMVKEILAIFGEVQTVELLQSQNMISTIAFAKKYFDVFERIASVSVGK